MKRILIILSIILVIGGFSAFVLLSEKTYFHDESIVGNTGGNLLNGGLFCEDDNLIYFSNSNDDGALYSMNLSGKDFKKIHSDNASYINAAGKYIVYVRDNHKRKHTAGNFFNFNNVGVYRINRNGSKIKMLYNDPAKYATLKGNYVYYQHYNTEDGLKFYRVKIDGSDEKKLSDDPIIPASFSGNMLFYNGQKDEHNIYQLNTDSTASSLVYEGNCYNPIATDNYIYYLSLDNNYAIARIDKDGSNPNILVDERVSFYNISNSGKYIYYQVDGGDNNRLCKLNLETLQSKTLLEGDFSSIHVTSNFVFFKEFDTNKIYQMSVSNDKISTFDPPVLKD